MSELLYVWDSFTWPDSLSLQDLAVTQDSNDPKDPDFQRQQHTCTPKLNEALPELHFKDNVPKDMFSIQIFSLKLKSF